jgi:hypothetical protein
MGLGTVAVLGGVLIFLASAKTDVTQNQTGGSGSNRRLDTAWKRLPTWRASPNGTLENGAAPAQFPVLFSHSF